MGRLACRPGPSSTKSRQSESFMLVRRTVPPALAALCSILFLAIPSATGAAENDAAPALKVALKEMALGLESPAFNIREATSERLIGAQAPAVPVMLSVAKDGNL